MNEFNLFGIPDVLSLFPEIWGMKKIAPTSCDLMYLILREFVYLIDLWRITDIEKKKKLNPRPLAGIKNLSDWIKPEVWFVFNSSY